MTTALRELLDAVPTALGVHSRKDALWTYVNPAMASLVGYPNPEALIGTSAMSLVATEEQRSVVEARRTALAQGERLGFHTTAWRRHDGSHVRVEVSAALVDFEERPSVLVVGRDLTERDQLKAKLSLADRMASLGTLAAGVAHEINNPLTYIALSLELITRELLASPPGMGEDRLRRITEMLGDARQGAERVKRVVSDLRVLSRADDERRVRVDLRVVLDLAIKLASNEIRHRARLVKVYDDVPLVTADGVRLGQAFLNLLVNAAQAIPEGSADDNEIRIVTHTNANGDAVVAISDTGCGIAPQVMAHIFDPFFTTKAIGEGTGLGLAICHGIVASLGGDIITESEPGKGTVFRVTLPAAREQAGTVETPTESAMPKSMRRGRVLVIDDDPILGQACRNVLSDEHDVSVLTSGAGALERISGGESFDVILCDLMMPQMTGMEFHAALARLVPSQAKRIVFMTGGAFTQASRAFLGRISNEWVEKPFSMQRLREVVRSVVE